MKNIISYFTKYRNRNTILFVVNKKENYISRIAIIYGSSRPSKVGATVAGWFKSKLDLPDGIELGMVDLAEQNLPMLSELMPPMMGQYSQETTKNWATRIASFDGVIFVIAEYNLGYTPILKNAIDTLFAEWKGKSAAIVSYGAYPVSSSAEQLKVVLKPFEMKLAVASFHVDHIHKAISEDSVLDEANVSGSSPQAVFDEVVSNLAKT